MNIDGVKYLNGKTSQAVASAAGIFYGLVVNSHTSGTLKIWDNTEASGTVICNTITFAAGPNYIFFPKGICFNTGLYFERGGTIDYTALYKTI